MFLMTSFLLELSFEFRDQMLERRRPSEGGEFEGEEEEVSGFERMISSSLVAFSTWDGRPVILHCGQFIELCACMIGV